jgi:hypothetical protein
MMREWGYAAGFPMGPFGMLIIAALLAVPFWRICDRLGIPGVTAVLIVVPMVNVVFLYWLAFAEWPRHNPEIPAT